MSNRRRPRAQNPVTAMIAALDGARVPGGCGSCDAYQVASAMQGHPDVHVIGVFHDDDCPELDRIDFRTRGHG